MSVVPKTVVLVISTHGKVTVDDKDAEEHTFIFPAGIKMTKLNVSTYGECNIVDEDQMDTYVKKIKRNMRSLLSPRRTMKTFRSLASTFHKEDTSALKSLKPMYKALEQTLAEDKAGMDTGIDMTEAKDLHKIYRGYFSGFDRNYTMETKKTGDITLNKFYLRENKTATTNDWVIKAVNIPGEPDLMSWAVRQTRNGTSRITLEELVHMLRTYGVKEVIIFDFSCSDIGTKDLENDLNLRETRRNRRAFLSKHKPEYVRNTARLRRSARRRKIKTV